METNFWLHTLIRPTLMLTQEYFLKFDFKSVNIFLTMKTMHKISPEKSKFSQEKYLFNTGIENCMCTDLVARFIIDKINAALQVSRCILKYSDMYIDV